MAIPRSPFEAGEGKALELLARRAAIHCRYAWHEFRTLPGYEQSKHVAFYWIETATAAVLSVQK